MRRTRGVALLFAASALTAACEQAPLTAPTELPARLDVAAPEQRGGAVVLNRGEGQPGITRCSFDGFTTTTGTVVRTPHGGALLHCEFEGLPPIPERVEITGWFCSLLVGGTTVQSRWVRFPDGRADLTCHFGDKPVFNAIVDLDGRALPAQEPRWSLQLADLPGGALAGEVVFVGRACNSDLPLQGSLAGSIALIERGICPFTEKLASVLREGAIAAIVFNTAEGGDVLIQMGGTEMPIPAVFVGRTSGLELLGALPASVRLTTCGSSTSCRGAF